jgi:aerobic-type carbon monoxide dehydrogenase small subunit (CoxS/CutS family)
MNKLFMEIYINDQVFAIDESHHDMPLLWVLRDLLKLKGTKYGCGIGACGSCTVLIDDRAVPSCLIRIQDLVGKKITTIEGISESSSHPVQKAWVDLQVPQCGYCQSGQIMTAIALLKQNRNPDDEAIKQAMSVVLCRCGTYPRIVQAIKAVAQATSE